MFVKEGIYGTVIRCDNDVFTKMRPSHRGSTVEPIIRVGGNIERSRWTHASHKSFRTHQVSIHLFCAFHSTVGSNWLSVNPLWVGGIQRALMNYRL